jgi:hypothetical protein
MKRALVVLVLVAVLPACGLLEKLTGGGDKEGQTRHGIQQAPVPIPVKPIAPEELVLLLPKLEGWDAQPPVGEFVDAGSNKVTQATGNYARKIEELALSATLKIVDGAYAADVYGPLARMAHGQPGDPHKMPINVEGGSGIQEWRPDTGQVDVALVVADRFLVTLEGQNLSPQVVQAFLGGIDTKKLTAWAGKKPPAPAH